MHRTRARRLAAALLAAGLACGRGAGGAARDGGAARAATPDGSGPAAAQSGAQQPDERSGRVVLVRDGDSIVVRADRARLEVRLDGVDCPELAQASGRRAKRFTADLVFGKTVRLAVRGRDRYGRELAEVFLPDGRSLNRELVAAGLAWWYRRYSGDRGLERLEGEARAARRGLWADPSPVPPWDFRDARQPPPGPRR